MTNRPNFKRPLRVLAAAGWLGALHAPSWAHEGHGMPGFSHWHASDTLGLLLGAAVAVGVAWWFQRRK